MVWNRTVYFGLMLFALGCDTKSDASDASDALSCGEGTHQEGDRCVADSTEPDHETEDGGTDEDDSEQSDQMDTGGVSDGDTGSEPDGDTGSVPDGDDTGSSPESEDTGSDPPLVKSPKRGLSYNLLDTHDFAAISAGVSWWYNWYFRSDAPADHESAHHMQFVPMLWGHNSESDYVELESWMLDHPDVNDLLLMNEPNLVEQANITPTEAVAHWLRYEQFQADMLTDHGRSIRLIGPAITWGTMPGYEDPVVWLDAFYEAFRASEGRDPIIDALAFHWYDYGLDGQLTRLEGYGKDFWVTEMANWHTEVGWTIDTPEKQIDAMIDMVDICETRTDVERYAWFIGRWDPDPHYTSIFGDAPGELTALGSAYLDQPW